MSYTFWKGGVDAFGLPLESPFNTNLGVVSISLPTLENIGKNMSNCQKFVGLDFIMKMPHSCKESSL